MRHEPFLGWRREAEARAARLHEARGQRFDAALRWVADDPRGRLVLWELMARSNWLASRLACTSTADGARGACDPHLTAWNDGRAEAGNYLFGTLNRLCPGSFLQMQSEAAQRAAADAITLKGDDDDRHAPQA